MSDLNIYYDKDADLSVLKDKTIAIIGYGSQGHAQGQNMRDSGLNVIIAEVEGTDNYKLAKEAGFEVMDAAAASAKADIIQVLVPDESQKVVYEKFLAANMTAGKALVFSHGFNIHFKAIVPPKDIDVYMVAPKGPGHLVRSVFVEGGGVPCLIAIYQDATGEAKARALAHASGVGGGRAGVIETTFKDETETDLFGEQAVLCGGASELMKAGFEVLTEAGYPPEMAYFECVHEMKLIVDLIYKKGFADMRFSISNTAEYGDYSRGKRLITAETKAEMKKILTEIQDGSFAKEWIGENENGCGNFLAMRKENAEHEVEVVGKKLRSMMGFLGK
jgi:ketol-acid reductoisomerase